MGMRWHCSETDRVSSHGGLLTSSFYSSYRVLKYTQKEGIRENPRTVEDRSSLYFLFKVITRETGEGWFPLTVETEVNGDSKRTNERGPSLVGSLGLSWQYKRFLFCLGCSSRSSTKYFFPHRIHYFNYFFPIAQQAGQAAGLGRLSLSVCLWA
jgi:hypothetical protein